MIAASDALSTSVTKSLCCFLLTWIRSRSSDARLMICAARRAAFTAILSMGCMRRILVPGQHGCLTGKCANERAIPTLTTCADWAPSKRREKQHGTPDRSRTDAHSADGDELNTNERAVCVGTI